MCPESSTSCCSVVQCDEACCSKLQRQIICCKLYDITYTHSLSRFECLPLAASFFSPLSLSLPHTLYPVVWSHHWNVEDRSSNHLQRVASHAAPHYTALLHTTIPLISPKSRHDPNFWFSPETVSIPISDFSSQARPTLVLSILRFQVSPVCEREIHLSLIVVLAFKLHFFRFLPCFSRCPLNIFQGFFIFLRSIQLVFSHSLIVSLSLYFRSFAQAHTKTLVPLLSCNRALSVVPFPLPLLFPPISLTRTPSVSIAVQKSGVYFNPCVFPLCHPRPL